MQFEIFNEDCLITMEKLIEQNKKVDVILTSPPYNTARKGNLKSRPSALKHRDTRYDMYADTKTTDEYIKWMCDLFNKFDLILQNNGVVLLNLSYGNDLQTPDSSTLMWLCVAELIKSTPFMTADRIIWKKQSAMPNNVRSNILTRIVEDVFVFCRKTEYPNFNGYKELSKIGVTGQKFYKNVTNFIEAKNNDGPTKINLSTYSSELCEKLLKIYAQEGNIIYDPFNGTGTTGVACKRLNMDYIGSEISQEQCEYSINRIKNT